MKIGYIAITSVIELSLKVFYTFIYILRNNIMIDELPNNNNLKNNIIDSLDNNTKKEHESSKLKIFL